MATMDHTARARPQVRNEPSSPPDPFIDQRPPLSLGLEKFDNFTAKLTGISLAINVVQGVLERSETSKQANAPRSRLTYWLLNPAQVAGLHAAVHLLQQ